MRKTNSISFKEKRKFALLVDGDCEFWYFQMLKRNNRHLSVDLKPEIPQKKRLSEQYARVLEYAKIYDKVIWIVDLDVVNDETRKTKKGDTTALQDFDRYIAATRKMDNVMVIVNNPCLEFWFLLHFEATSKFFSECAGAEKQLKKHIPGYEKKEKFFVSQGHDIYIRLRPYLNAAIANAEKMKPYSPVNIHAGISEMYKFFNLPEIRSTL